MSHFAIFRAATPRIGESPAPLRRRWNLVLVAKLVLGIVIAGIAVTTPGFLSADSIVATIDFAALIGLVALGMVFITISGNIMSLALGATMASCAMAFLGLTQYGFTVAVCGTLALGVVLNAAQGAVIGVFRANPLIVSIAALASITGLVTAATGGSGVVLPPGVDLSPLRIRIGPVEAPTLALVSCAIIAQLVLSYTRFGRELLLVGSSIKAADAAGIRVSRVVGGAYAAAGAFAAIAGIVAAIRFESASLELGHAYDYDAIAAVLIGGTLVSGGQGSAWQTVLGALVFAAMTTLLALGGYSQEAQRLLTGSLILAVMCLHAAGEK
jgi:ribose/xylose/arabinose/galactoside ABC-type transport system permease subunit